MCVSQPACHEEQLALQVEFEHKNKALRAVMSGCGFGFEASGLSFGDCGFGFAI